MSSAAWPHLRGLHAGDRVPAECYVLAYADGTAPRWLVHEAVDVGAGCRRLVLVDPDNGADDLFDDGIRAAITVITCERFTRRSQPHRLGGGRGSMLCDMDQQARHSDD